MPQNGILLLSAKIKLLKGIAERPARMGEAVPPGALPTQMPVIQEIIVQQRCPHQCPGVHLPAKPARQTQAYPGYAGTVLIDASCPMLDQPGAARITGALAQ